MTRRFFFGLLIFATIFWGYAATPMPFRAAAQSDAPTFYIDLEWSPDGTHLAFTRTGEFASHVGLLNFDTGEINLLTAEMAGYQDKPVWSPDGTQLAFRQRVERSTGTATTLWIMNYDGTQARSLTEDLPHDFVPIAFSPDGNTIYAIEHVFNAATGIDEVILWAVEVENEHRQTIDLVTDGIPYALAFSPDGTQLRILSYANSEFSLSVADGEGFQNVRAIFSSRDDFTSLAWSLDGASILYETSGSPAIFLMDIATGSQTSFAQTITKYGGSPKWSPDGSQFAFRMQSDSAPNRFTIWSIQLDGTHLTELSAAVLGEHTYLTWSPDGTAIAFVATEYPELTSEIWLIQADGSNPINLNEAAPAD